MRVWLTIALVFLGCCANVVVLEKLVADVPGVANLITFLQFAFVAAEGFVVTSRCGSRASRIPVGDCAALVALFFVASVCNNYAYELGVPNTLHIVVKSGSIVANMIMGAAIKRRAYAREKYASAALITIGIIVCTLASAKTDAAHATAHSGNFFAWCCGVALLVLALLIGAGMGLMQESLYLRCGKHSDDVLYLTHLLPLPLFAFLRSDLARAAHACSQSAPFDFLAGRIPSAWLLIAVNVVSQYVCIRSVYTLTSERSSLTVTLVLTLRKFSSLVLSIVLFDNAFTASHWLGSAFVFVGTLFFFEVITLGKAKAS